MEGMRARKGLEAANEIPIGAEEWSEIVNALVNETSR